MRDDHGATALEEILADIRSDRVKKVIMDCDAYNDIDDQYAIAFALASDKIDVLTINATLFNNYRCNGYEVIYITKTIIRPNKFGRIFCIVLELFFKTFYNTHKTSFVSDRVKNTVTEYVKAIFAE